MKQVRNEIANLSDLPPGALETLLDQIVLIDKTIKTPASYKPGGELPYRARDYSNPAVLKRSYNAMEMLSGNAKSLARLLQPKFRYLGLSLLLSLDLNFKKKKEDEDNNEDC